jgi:hypothetical protein
MSKSTNKELVTELTERNTEGKYDKLIERAKDNGYHDFKFDEDKYEDCICPKMDLVEDLKTFPELNDIREAVIGGDYDESPDEEDTRKMEEDFPIIKLFNNISYN